MDDFLIYLKTFNPDVRHEYYKMQYENMYEWEYFLANGFDEWLRAYGAARLQKSVVENMVLEIRNYNSKNGMSVIYLIPRCNEYELRKLANANKAIDIRDVQGRSIIGMNRHEISLMGLEFFFITKRKSMEINVQPEYHIDRFKMLHKYTKNYFRNLVNIISSDMTKIKTGDHINNLFSSLDTVVKTYFNEALIRTKINANKEGKIYDHNDILSMVDTNILIGQPIKGKSKRMRRFLENINNTLGVEIVDWIKLLPENWKKIHMKIDGRNISKNSSRDQEEFNEIHSSISSFITPNDVNHKDYFENVYSGNAYYQNRGVLIKKRRQKRKKSRAELFDDVDIKCKCSSCGSEACESGKMSAVGGKILKFSNITSQCPRSIYEAKKMGDSVFGGKMVDLSQKMNAKNRVGIHGIIVVKSTGEFNMRSSSVTMKKVNKNQTPGLIKMNSIGNQMYSILEEESADTESGARYLEYEDNKIPNILFLIETK